MIIVGIRGLISPLILAVKGLTTLERFGNYLMKRFISTALIAVFLAFSFSTLSLCATEETASVNGNIASNEQTTEQQNAEIKLTVNGRRIDTLEKYGVSVTVQDGNIFIPLAAIADTYEAQLKWDEETSSAECTVDDITAAFTADSKQIVVNGESISIETPIRVLNGQTIVSSEALSAAFGLMIDYNSEKARATVIKKDPVREKDLAEKQELAQNGGKNKGSKAKEIITVISAMNKGFLATLKLFFITLIGALPLGLIIALCSMSKFLPLKYFTRLLVWIIRGTPLMLQLLIIFYIPGMVLESGSPWPRGEEGRFIAASVAFIINYAFYFSEIYRGGIENVPKGQVEAGQVLGMTKTQIFFNVTLLQMIKRIVPPMSNEIITLVKDTSIARIISMQEVIWAGYAFLKSSHGYSGLLWPLFFTGVYYLLFNGILTILFGKIEKKLSYFN